MRGVWRELLGEEPEAAPAYAPDWAEQASGEALAEAARRHLVEIPCTEFRAGDVLLFRWRRSLPAKHAGIARIAGHMIHAHEGASRDRDRARRPGGAATWPMRSAFRE